MPLCMLTAVECINQTRISSLCFRITPGALLKSGKTFGMRCKFNFHFAAVSIPKWLHKCLWVIIASVLPGWKLVAGAVQRYRKTNRFYNAIPHHPLWPSYVHIRGHFYGNALLPTVTMNVEKNLLLVILAIRVQIVRVCLFPLLPSASFLFFVSSGEQIDVWVLDKTDQDDSKYVRCNHTPLSGSLAF